MAEASVVAVDSVEASDAASEEAGDSAEATGVDLEEAEDLVADVGSTVKPSCIAQML